MFNNEQKKQIEKVLSFLTDKQKNENLIEIENIEGNQKLINYLEQIGPFEVKYSNKGSQQLGHFFEIGGNVLLWHININDIWVINLVNISRFYKI